MLITFFSSVLNHHQISLSDCLAATDGVTFYFVQMMPLNDERKQQGFSCYQRPYLVMMDEDPEKAKRLCLESDVVIAGVAPQEWVNARIASGKLTFAYKERFGKSLKSFFSPSFLLNGFRNYFAFRNKELYLLCASAYTASDTTLIFPRPSKKLKWGYFPLVSHHENTKNLLVEKEPFSILWVGRFLAYKHPETAIKLAKRLKNDGYGFSLTIIGTGELEEDLKRMVKEEKLDNYVKILNAVPNEEVRRYMRQNEVLLFTSDRKEGWGAVLNEAMSEGCACIASKQAGSTEYLIDNGVNGFSFNYDDFKSWYECLKKLIEDREATQRIQKNAIHTIETDWNEKIAATRLVEFSKSILCNGNNVIFHSGPMSQA